jgi:hypothetical protein
MAIVVTQKCQCRVFTFSYYEWTYLGTGFVFEYRQNLLLFNPLPALMYHNVLDLHVACRAKRTGMYINLNAHRKKRSLPAHVVGM